jgi:hypothetical protein
VVYYLVSREPTRPITQPTQQKANQPTKRI